MTASFPDNLISLSVDEPIWDRFFAVAPLVLVGSKEADGSYDLAPKHMAMPLGWQNYFCFVCTPRHATYHNIKQFREFTVSYPRPSQIIESSLAAAPRESDRSKPSLEGLPTFPAVKVDGVLVQGCYLCLECRLHTLLDGFGDNSLIVGAVVAAAIDEDSLRREEMDDNDLVYESPLLAYLNPGRLAKIQRTVSFPFPVGFCR